MNLSPSTFENLKHNVKLLGLKNVKCYNYDIVKFFNDKNILEEIKFQKK